MYLFVSMCFSGENIAFSLKSAKLECRFTAILITFVL